MIGTCINVRGAAGGGADDGDVIPPALNANGSHRPHPHLSQKAPLAAARLRRRQRARVWIAAGFFSTFKFVPRSRNASRILINWLPLASRTVNELVLRHDYAGWRASLLRGRGCDGDGHHRACGVRPVSKDRLCHPLIRPLRRSANVLHRRLHFTPHHSATPAGVTICQVSSSFQTSTAMD